MKINWQWLLAGIVLLLITSLADAQTKHALLIGIGEYSPRDSISLPSCSAGQPNPDGRFGLEPTRWPNLRGPDNDVESMRALLEQTYGFRDITVLNSAQATREGILQAIDEHMIRDTKPGDLVVFYFSGHGSLRLNSKSNKPDHMDETIVPADADACAYDIRDKELAQRFNRVLALHAKLVAIFDSCNSGTQARGRHAGVSRSLPYDDRDVAADPNAYNGSDLDHVPAEGNAVILTAALSTQAAQEQMFAEDHRVHGVFTKALIDALQSATGTWRAVDVLNSAQAYLRADEWEQQPTIEGNTEDSLFGEPTSNHRLRAAVTKSTSDGVVLNVGGIAGFDKGTQFSSLGEGREGRSVVLEVTGIDSPISATAKVVSGSMNFRGGEMFELSKLRVAPYAKLRVFVPGHGSLSRRDLNSVAAKRQFASLNWVDDPVESPDYLVVPTAGGWRAVAQDGSMLSAINGNSSNHRAQMPTAFLAMAPASQLVKAMEGEPAVRNGNVELTDELSGAQYLLLGRDVANGGASARQFALVSTAVLGPRPAGGYVSNSKPPVVCSTDSSLPIRGPWIKVDPTKSEDAAGQLITFAAKLAKVRSWTQLMIASQPLPAWPYRLAIRTTAGDAFVGTGANEALSPNTGYDVVLAADPYTLRAATLEPKYVYVVSFNCAGSSNLIYPRMDEAGGAPLPMLTLGNPLPVITLRSAAVKEPLGAETFFVLITQDKITDLDRVLSFGASNSPEEVVRGAGAISFKEVEGAPINWSVQKVVLTSRPKD